MLKTKKSMLLSIAAILAIGVTNINAMDFSLTGKIGYKSFDYNEYDTSGALLDSKKIELSDGSVINTGGLVFKVESKEALIGNSNFASFTFSKSIFDTQYTGSLRGGGGNGSVLSTTENTLDTYQLTYGEVFNLSKSLKNNLSFGLGYKLWDSKLSTIQDVKFSFTYVSLGYAYEYAFNNTMSIGIGFEAFKAISPKMKYQDPTNNITFDLGNIYGFNINVPLTYNITKNLSSFVEYEYGYLEITKNNINLGLTYKF